MRFAELCPGHPGCVAVEYVAATTARGTLAWPEGMPCVGVPPGWLLASLRTPCFRPERAAASTTSPVSFRREIG